MRLIIILGLILVLTTPTWGGFQEGGNNAGGFQGPGAANDVTTVAQARAARDDTPCVLTGHIVRREAGDHEHYLFRDATGDIIVDIDDDLFMGRTVTPQSTIRIYGEVDKEAFERTKIDVKRFDIQ
jgi:uncharacterized protein (TIGR00156 family)